MQSTRNEVQLAAKKVKTFRNQHKQLLRQEKTAALEKIRTARMHLRQAEREFLQSAAFWESMMRRLDKLITVRSRGMQPAG